MSIDLNSIINAAINRDGSSASGQTMVVSNHLAQMKLFGIRKGIEFYPLQDDEADTRKKFIQDLFLYNRVDLFLDAIWDLYLGKGDVLFYLRPAGNTYEISWYSRDEFRAYYKPGGRELDRVIITYSYQQQAPNAIGEVERWIRLVITETEIRKSDLDRKPEMEGLMSSPTDMVVQNSLRFIPCVVVSNNARRPGQYGTSEFHWLKDQIEAHDSMMTSITTNIEFFANPTLVSTRSLGEITEAVDQSGPVKPTMASKAGFSSASRPSTAFKDLNYYKQKGGIKVKRVIGGVGADERIGYIVPDPISGDANRYAAQYREEIRTALGGVDETGINTGATAFEIKSLYGRAAATAAKKALAIYDYGLCKIFEMAVFAEEELFREGFAQAIKWDAEKNGPIPDYVIDAHIDGNEKTKPKGVPPGVIGLRPNGDRTVKWRFTGPVFEDSPQDKLNLSIIGRNMAEEGVNTTEVFKTLYPEKTEKEIEAMLGGVPFRRVNSIGTVLNQILQLISSMGAIPDPENPELPIVARYNLTPLIEKVLTALFEELNHGRRYDPASIVNAPTPNFIGSTGLQPSLPPGAQPNSPMDAQQWSGAGTNAYGMVNAPVAAGGTIPIAASSGVVPPELYAASPGNLPPGPGGNGATAQQGSRYPEFSSYLPVPGGTVSGPTATPTPAVPAIGATYGGQQYGDADLARQPGILEQLFPTFSAAVRPKKRSPAKRGDKK
jgi:hypothetical protein